MIGPPECQSIEAATLIGCSTTHWFPRTVWGKGQVGIIELEVGIIELEVGIIELEVGIMELEFYSWNVIVE
jgi:hypothetical protein